MGLTHPNTLWSTPTTDPALATRAIITTAAAVSTWFDTRGSDTADRIATQYAALALAMVDAWPARSPASANPPRTDFVDHVIHR
ncbi:hypothetical protein [Actinokineospora spheciospongiae]|uniref:hypothetical protein n=1 Tax=Actinokineospora spheciospongiae TaxID=909613 RepID=UPI0013789BF4